MWIVNSLRIQEVQKNLNHNGFILLLELSLGVCL